MLVLASASPRRCELLRELGAAFVVDAPGIDEDEVAAAAASPCDVALELARRKARAVAARRGDGWPVLAADTLVVTSRGEILGKPRDAADARRMLRALAGTTQSVITGVCLLAAGAAAAAAVETHVTMRSLTAAEIASYVASGEPFGKAGGYAIQETGDRFVTAIQGSWSNVVGLPLEVVAGMLRGAGIDVPQGETACDARCS